MIERDGNGLEYDGMTLQRVARPTPECAAALEKRRCRRRCRISLPGSALPPGTPSHVLTIHIADAAWRCRRIRRCLR